MKKRIQDKLFLFDKYNVMIYVYFCNQTINVIKK